VSRRDVCPHCDCDAGVHFINCPRAGGPISFSFDGLFQHNHEDKSLIHLIVIDTETGGLDPSDRCIIELAARLVRIDIENRAVRVPRAKLFHAYIKPDRPVHPQAAAVNGYREDWWEANAMSQVDAFDQFIDYLEGLDHEDMMWAGSNVTGFDLPFLRSDLDRFHLELPGKPKMSHRTLNTESLCFPLFVEGQTESCGIAALRKWAGCPGEQRHNAIDDVEDAIRIIASYFQRRVWPFTGMHACKCGQAWLPAAGLFGTTEETTCPACRLRKMNEELRNHELPRV
jgi:DNA polymerase III epsilon subunit-like protein